MLSGVTDPPGDKAALDAAGVQLAQPEVVRRVQGRLQVPVHPQAVRRAGAPLRRPRQRLIAKDAQTQEGVLHFISSPMFACWNLEADGILVGSVF